MIKERLLIVDDDELLLDSYELFLSTDYNVVTAESGEEALKILQNDSNFAIIVSDYNMSGMNGIDFLNQVKEIYPDIVRILLTAVKDIEVVLNAVNESNIFRFLVKDENLSKLSTALKDGIDIKSILRREKKLQEELKETYNRLEQDLKAAADLQQEIQPKPLSFSGYSFDSLYLPSKYLSGDNFNYFLFENWIVFYVLDVTGHGIPASMLSFAVSRMINSDKLPSNPILSISNGEYQVCNPNQALSQLNKIFMTKGDNSQFFAINYGVIHLDEFKFKISNAANRKPVLINSDGVSELDVKGLPIGFLDDAKYSEIEKQVRAGDKLILYTDGIIELQNPENEMFGEKRFFEVLNANRNKSISEILEELKKQIKYWSNKKEHNDDITVLCIQKN